MAACTCRWTTSRAEAARTSDLDDRRMTEPWQRVLRRVAGRTQLAFVAGRDVCDGVRGRLRYELRCTWLGGVRILERLDRIDYDVFAHRPRLRAGDRAPSLLWRASSVAEQGGGPMRRNHERRATSFYYSFLALPADKRNAIVAVWDFCRAVDDAVDEPGDRRSSVGARAVARASWRVSTTAASRRRRRASTSLPFSRRLRFRGRLSRT